MLTANQCSDLVDALVGPAIAMSTRPVMLVYEGDSPDGEMLAAIFRLAGVPCRSYDRSGESCMSDLIVMCHDVFGRYEPDNEHSVHPDTFLVFHGDHFGEELRCHFSHIMMYPGGIPAEHDHDAARGIAVAMVCESIQSASDGPQEVVCALLTTPSLQTERQAAITRGVFAIYGTEDLPVTFKGILQATPAWDKGDSGRHLALPVNAAGEGSAAYHSVVYASERSDLRENPRGHCR